MSKTLLGSFKTRAGEPFFWFVHANQLLTSAVTLVEEAEAASARYFAEMPAESGRHQLTPQQQEAWPKLGMRNVALLLFGLALEVLLKGFLVARDPSLVQQQRIAAEISSGHDLKKLFAGAGIGVSVVEAGILDRLSESITWASKYPVPISQEKFKPVALPTGGYTFPGAFSDQDIEVFTSLWNRVQSEIENDPTVPAYTAV
jgi:hypothetical protein